MAKSSRTVSLGEAFGVWLQIALRSFGGPAGQIGVMHRILVEERRWISEKRFFHALNYSMVLPGPEAMQLATYVGWLMHGVRGGLIAGGLFVLPGFVAILALSIAYALYQDTALLEALFFGLKAAVLAVVLHAVYRLGRRAVQRGIHLMVAGAAFVGIFFLQVPFPIIILGAGLVGWWVGRTRPDWFVPPLHQEETKAVSDEPPLLPDTALPRERPHRGRTVKTVSVWLAVWWLPVLLLLALAGPGSVFVHEALFFSVAAVVTFGGAYAVLAYVAQQAVEHFGWLLPGEMLDGLGMAEATPGPLIQVVQFVGFLGAHRHTVALDPITAGVIASIVVTWVTFVPCFLWIFTGAPYIEGLRANRAVGHALGAITAAVVGVILNLALWFALHVLFASLEARTAFGFVRLLVPDLATLDWAALVLAAFAFFTIVRLKWDMLVTLGVVTALGLGWRLLVG